jgi:hypothetical protein
MKRTFPAAASLAAVLALTALCALLPAAAGAKPATKTCVTTSRNVTTKNVKGTLTASNVDPSQQSSATCATAKKVMNKLLSLRIEEPKAVEGFRCTPSVLRTEPDVVKYSCVFRGADTATLIKLAFTAHYDQD